MIKCTVFIFPVTVSGLWIASATRSQGTGSLNARSHTRLTRFEGPMGHLLALIFPPHSYDVKRKARLTQLLIEECLGFVKYEHTQTNISGKSLHLFQVYLLKQA